MQLRVPTWSGAALAAAALTLSPLAALASPSGPHGGHPGWIFHSDNSGSGSVADSFAGKSRSGSNSGPGGGSGHSGSGHGGSGSGHHGGHGADGEGHAKSGHDHADGGNSGPGTVGGDVVGNEGSGPQVSPVPEPHTWMLMLGGLALVVGTLRRTRAGR